MDCNAFWAFLVTSFMLSAFGIRSVSSAYMKIFSHKLDEYTTTSFFYQFQCTARVRNELFFPKVYLAGKSEVLASSHLV